MIIASPHITAAPTVTQIMRKVLLALLPGIAVYVWQFGPAILVGLVLATGAALASEAIMLKLRGVPVKPFLTDLSAVVTAWLLALSLPPLAPWWLVVLGAAFAIVVAKQLYGGLGNNPFNPAMTGYVALIISFPALMTPWIGPSDPPFLDALGYIFAGRLPPEFSLDAITTATPLDTLKTQLQLQKTVEEITTMSVFGNKEGKMIALAYLLGGLYLLQQRVIGWRLPVAYLLAFALTAGVMHAFDASRYASPWFHLSTGGAMLGAFFIVTDPVTGATTPKGKLIFGAGAGFLTYVIRVFGGYPDGVAFGILLMNMAAPLIDAYTQPPVFGHKKNTSRESPES